MKLSKFNMRKINLKDVDEVYLTQDMFSKMGELYQYESGIFGYGNIVTKLKTNIENVIREELDKIDCIECRFATMQPKSLWEKSGRWNRFVNEDNLMFTIKTDKNEYGMGPTAEEAAIVFAHPRLQSNRNLPAAYYQITDKFRNEIRPRGYLLRTKVFTMLDVYSFDENEEEMIKSYNLLHEAYVKIYKRLGLKVFSVTSDNGNMGGSVSEEWMAFTNLGEDTVYYDEKRNCGYNKEVLEIKTEKELKENYGITNLNKLTEHKALELGHTFQLDTKYSESMKLYFNSNNEQKPYYMGCYGMGIDRILATILAESAIFDDNNNLNGISLPENIAPYKLHIVYNDQKKDIANNLYKTLLNENIQAIIDDRENLALGSKIKDSTLLGCPYIIVLGNKHEDNIYEIENTKTGKKEKLNLEELILKLKNL